VAESETERNGRSGNGTDHGRPGSREERLRGLVGSDPVEVPTAGQDEDERWSEGAQRRQEPTSDPGRVADDGYGLTTGPGVTWPRATALRNCDLVIQWYVVTASCCINGTITNPPP
jgi:hypothetical protein